MISSTFTRKCVPLESTRSPLQFPSESAQLPQQHSAQQCVRNLIRARDTVLVTSETNPSGDIFTLSTLLKNVELSLIVIFFAVSPSNCVISSSWSPLHVMTQLASSSMGQATLIALSCSSSFFTVFLKIHRFSNFSCSGSKLFQQLLATRHLRHCARSGLSFRTIDSKLPCRLHRLFHEILPPQLRWQRPSLFILVSLSETSFFVPSRFVVISSSRA